MGTDSLKLMGRIGSLSSDRYHVLLSCCESFCGAFECERHSRSSGPRLSLAFGVATGLDQDRQPRGYPLSTVDHLTNISGSIHIALIEQQIRVSLVFVSSGHQSGSSASQHIAINRRPIDLDRAMASTKQYDESAADVSIGSYADKQTRCSSDQGSPPHKNMGHLHKIQRSGPKGAENKFYGRDAVPTSPAATAWRSPAAGSRWCLRRWCTALRRGRISPPDSL